MDAPFTITVYDKAFVRRGTIGDPISVVATPRHNQQSTAAITLDSDHHRLTDLTAPGARVVLHYQGGFLMSGAVRLRQGEGPAAQGTVTVQLIDDWRLLTRILGWPAPTAGIAAQNTAEYDVRTGPAESVVKAYVAANAITRLGLPVTVAPDQGRGATITVQMRMHPLADRLLPVVDQAGVGITVRQSGAVLEVDCYESADFPRTLSEASGIVTEWSWSLANPEATRVVIGGDGEGTARTFRALVDTARETEWGDVIEVFRDARNANSPAEMDATGTEVLTEGSPTSGLSVRLAETSTFRYGQAIKVGDRVRIEVGPGVIVEDVLREATISWTRDSGLSVTPLVGERSDDPNRTLARSIARLARGIRNLNTR